MNINIGLAGLLSRSWINYTHTIIRCTPRSFQTSSWQPLLLSSYSSSICPKVNSRQSTILFNNGKLKFCTSPQSLPKEQQYLKDILLFRYENPRMFKMLNIFAIAQFTFWIYLSYFSYTSLRNVPVAVEAEGTQERSWYQKINLGSDKFRYGITIVSALLGYTILVSSWLFTLRTVRGLVLRKGGQKLSIVTYGPLGPNKTITVPLEMVSCLTPRSSAKVSLPLKVLGTWWYYSLDMRGSFPNPNLFDTTVGVFQKFR